MQRRNVFRPFDPIMSSTSPISRYLETKIIHRAHPEAVIYDLTNPYQTQITLPMNSTWSSGLHWHETHTEYLQILQGSVKVSLNGVEQIVHAPQPGEEPIVLVVKRGVRHEWSRAELDDGVDVVVVESTDPKDGLKTVFFWSVNAVVLEGMERIKSAKSDYGKALAEWVLWWKLMLVFWDLDNWPVVFGSRDIVQWISTFAVLRLVSFLSWTLDMKVVREESMPIDAWKLWMSRAANGKED